MSKKIELKVQIVCDKCKTTIMKSVAKLNGVKSINLDAEKNILTITGTVDVVDVVNQLRKAKKPAEIISVGPEKKEEKKDGKNDEKKDDKKNGDDKKNNDKKNGEKKEESKPCQMTPLCCCGSCQQRHGFGPVVFYEEPTNNCTIF